MAQTAGEHLQELLTALQQLPGSFSEPPFLAIRSETRSLLIADVSLDGGLRLAVTVLAESSGGRVDWLTYRFHVMDGQRRCIVRFDDSSHHRDLPTYPHHKHEGPDERVVISEQPSIESHPAEIRGYIRSATGP